MRRPLVVLCAAALLSCTTPDDSTPPSFDAETRTRTLEVVDELARVEAAWVRLLDRASDGLTVDLGAGDLPTELPSRFHIEGAYNMHWPYRRLVIASYRLWDGAREGVAAGPPGDVAGRREPLLGAAGFLGVALFAAAGYQGVKVIYVAWSEPIFERARTDATPEELDVMRSALDLGPEVDGAGIEARMRELGPAGLIEARAEIHNGIQQAALDGVPGFRTWEADAQARAMANTANAGGRLAVRQVTSGLRMLRGPNSVSGAFQQVGLESGASTLVEVAFGQCADGVVERIDALVVGPPDTEEPVLIAGVANEDVVAALARLEDRGLRGSEVDVAVNTLASQLVAEAEASGLGVIVPGSLHAGRSEGGAPIEVPAGSTASAIIVPESRPAQESDLDLGSDQQVPAAFCEAPRPPPVELLPYPRNDPAEVIDCPDNLLGISDWAFEGGGPILGRWPETAFGLSCMYRNRSTMRTFSLHYAWQPYDPAVYVTDTTGPAWRACGDSERRVMINGNELLLYSHTHPAFISTSYPFDPADDPELAELADQVAHFYLDVAVEHSFPCN